MKPILKKIIIASTVIVCLLSYSFMAYATQQSAPTFQIQSVYSQDSNSTVDINNNPINLPFSHLPSSSTPNTYATGSGNSAIPIHYKAIHKLLSKTMENGQTTYHMESDVDTAVYIKLVDAGAQNNLLSFLTPHSAYASGSNNATNQSDYVTIHQRYALYWNYTTAVIYGNTQTLYQLTNMHAYWYRDNQSYTVSSAYFKASIAGTLSSGVNSPIYMWSGSTFVPQWATSGTTYTYNDTSSKPYASWPYIWPAQTPGSFGGIMGTIGYWSGSTWITATTLNTTLFPANVQGT